MHQSATLGLRGTSQSSTGEFWICHPPAPAPRGKDSGLCCSGGCSCAGEDEEKIHQRQWNHVEKMAQLKPCAVRTKLEPAQPVSPSHTSLCPNCPGMAHTLHPEPVPSNRSELGTSFTWPSVSSLYQTMLLYCFTGRTPANCAPNPKQTAHQTLGSHTSICHLAVDVQENSQSCLICL